MPRTVVDGRDHLDETVFRAALDADAGEAAADLLLQILEVGFVEIGRVRIEARHHAFDGRGEQLGVVDRLDVFLLDLPEHFGKQP
jgi:hypothetical protein